MGLLDGILEAIGPQGAGDFIRRFEQGPPWRGFDDREALEHYGRVAPALPPDEYRLAAEETFARFTPEERRQFGAHLVLRARRQDFGVPDTEDSRLKDPRTLADLTARLHGAGPGVLRGLLGADGGGPLSSSLARAALGGIAAVAMKRIRGAGR